MPRFLALGAVILAFATAAQAGWEAVGNKLNCEGAACGTPASRSAKCIRHYWVQFGQSTQPDGAYFSLDVNTSVTPPTRKIVRFIYPGDPMSAPVIQQLKEAYLTGKKLKWMYNQTGESGKVPTLWDGYSTTFFNVYPGEYLELMFE